MNYLKSVAKPDLSPASVPPECPELNYFPISPAATRFLPSLSCSELELTYKVHALNVMTDLLFHNHYGSDGALPDRNSMELMGLYAECCLAANVVNNEWNLLTDAEKAVRFGPDVLEVNIVCIAWLDIPSERNLIAEVQFLESDKAMYDPRWEDRVDVG